MFYFASLTAAIAALASASIQLKNETTYMIQAPLPYALDALAPVMSEHQLDLHYNKHHSAYVTNFNKLVDQSDAARVAGDFQAYTDLTYQLKFNGGGALNHDFFWASLSPQKSAGGQGGNLPGEFSRLHKLVSDEWGSFANMITFFNTQSAKLYGSGWVWLAYNNSTKKLEYRQTEVHDQLTELNSNLTPLLNLDLWEHAFYVDYENRKTDYLSGIWQIVNWDKVSERLQPLVKLEL